MSTAFGKAMIDSINGQPQSFYMSIDGHQPMRMPCSDFLRLRRDEIELIDELELPDDGNVLDYGCGIGRHLAHVRSKYPSIHCFGIEICDLLLEHCQRTISDPARFVRSFNELEGIQFDLIMLMGNGLGVLGSEQDALSGLRMLFQSLRQNGRILIEAGNFRNGYLPAQCTIDYQDLHDGPFIWGFSDRDWVIRQFHEIGCDVDIRQSSAWNGINFFYAMVQKTDE